MAKTFWIDFFNGPHIHFFQNIQSFVQNVIYTARDYKPIPDLLELYHINAAVIGKHGGKNKNDKLLASSHRIIDLATYISQHEIDLALHKHSVEAARVAWGFGIPSISFIDNELMVPQNMLVCPLAQVLIAPLAIEQYVLRNFTPAHVSILQYDGVSEVANVYNYRPDQNILTLLNLTSSRPIIVIRSEPILASYQNHESLTDKLVHKIQNEVPDAQIIRIDRAGESNGTKFPIFDARSLFYFADMVITGGGTMAREAALLGTRAITFFNNPLSVDRFLINNNILESYPGKEIFKLNFGIEIKKKRPTKQVPQFEHPFALLEKAEKIATLKLNFNNGKQ